MKILLPSARHLIERLTVIQSVSQAGMRSGKQAGRQAGKGAPKTKFGFFSVADSDYKRWETPNMQEHPTVEWSNTQLMVRPAPVQFLASGLEIAGGLGIAGSADRSTWSPCYTQPWLKTFQPETFGPPPPPQKKKGIRSQGDRGLKIKKSIGGSLCRAKL